MLHMHPYLVKHIIQTLIKILQVEQNNSSSSFHTDLDSVNVSAKLQKNGEKTKITKVVINQQLLQYLCVVLVTGKTAPKQYKRLVSISLSLGLIVVS